MALNRGSRSRPALGVVSAIEEAPIRPHNLPTVLTTFVGREREMRRLMGLLANQRLITLTGPGGVGKTRLAVEAARAELAAHKDGVWFIELAEVSRPEQVAEKVAWVLGQREESGKDLLESLVTHLRYSDSLLVLDNCEHLLDSCSKLVATVLDGCTTVGILCTSRERLGLPGETVWSLPALAVPKSTDSVLPEKLLEFPALTLFFDRAEQGDSVLDRVQSANLVATICQRLDGLPLAIELAAARARVLAPAQIAARLENRLALLTGGSRTAAARHQTLRATVTWSYELLSSAEQALLRGLAVFAGGFSLRSAEDIASGDDPQASAVLDLLASLIDKSLLVAENVGHEARYRMLLTIREFASERLSQAGEANLMRRRHAEHFCVLAEAAEPALHGPDQAEWLHRLEQEHENLREALAWCAASGRFDVGIRMAGALWRLWYVRGYFSEGRRWLELMLSGGVANPDAARARALRSAAVLARVQGDFARARDMYHEALAVFRNLEDKAGIAMTLNSLGILACALGDLDGAKKILGGESLATYEDLGDKRGVATCTNNLALVARAQGDYIEMQRLCLTSLKLYREVGFGEGVAASLLSLGVAAMLLGSHPEANRYAIESLTIYRDLGYREGVAEALQALASIAGAESADQRAARLYGASEALREVVAAPIPFAHERQEYDTAVNNIRRRMTPVAFRTEWALGRSMSMQDAVAYAMGGATGARRDDRPGGLSRREVQIAALVAQGLKDKEIAERLHISARTVGKHVEHIRDKLGLRSRTELGARMMRTGTLSPDPEGDQT